MNSIDRRETHKDATVAVDRRSSRNKVLKGAHVAFNNEFSAIPCTVRNVSETGARLVIEGGWFVPDTFVLHVDIDGYKIECKRVWQKGSECGVRFIGEKRMTRSKCQQVLTPDAELENVHLGRHQSRQNVVNSPSEAAGECPVFCVSVIWSMLPERSKDDDNFQGAAGRTSEGLRAA